MLSLAGLALGSCPGEDELAWGVSGQRWALNWNQGEEDKTQPLEVQFLPEDGGAEGLVGPGAGVSRASHASLGPRVRGCCSVPCVHPLCCWFHGLKDRGRGAALMLRVSFSNFIALLEAFTKFLYFEIIIFSQEVAKR